MNKIVVLLILLFINCNDSTTEIPNEPTKDLADNSDKIIDMASEITSINIPIDRFSPYCTGGTPVTDVWDKNTTLKFNGSKALLKCNNMTYYYESCGMRTDWITPGPRSFGWNKARITVNSDWFMTSQSGSWGNMTSKFSISVAGFNEGGTFIKLAGDDNKNIPIEISFNFPVSKQEPIIIWLQTDMSCLGEQKPTLPWFWKIYEIRLEKVN